MMKMITTSKQQKQINIEIEELERDHAVSIRAALTRNYALHDEIEILKLDNHELNERVDEFALEIIECHEKIESYKFEMEKLKSILARCTHLVFHSGAEDLLADILGVLDAK